MNELHNQEQYDENQSQNDISENIGVSEQIRKLPAGINPLASVGFLIIRVHFASHFVEISGNGIPLLDGIAVFVLYNVLHKIFCCNRISVLITGRNGEKSE